MRQRVDVQKLAAIPTARIASTTERVDPDRANANAAIKEEEMELEPLTGTWEAFKDSLPQEKQAAPAQVGVEQTLETETKQTLFSSLYKTLFKIYTILIIYYLF